MNRRLLFQVAFVTLAIQGCSASSQPVARMGVFDLLSQRISGQTEISGNSDMRFRSLSVLVTVDIDGNVIDAVSDNPDYKGDTRAALDAARHWKFKPQSFEGKPIVAVGSIPINLLPKEIPPDRQVPWPSIGAQGFEITLERSACFGSCPDYRVAISSDGIIRFSTQDQNFPGTAAEVHKLFSGQNVLLPGVHETKVDPQAVTRLLERFKAANFMGMEPKYVTPVTDNPTFALTLRIGGKAKRVVDYAGREAGMPSVVTDLEKAVDDLAETNRWVRGNAQTVALLKAEDFDFRSKDAAALIQSAIELAWRPDERVNAAALITAALAEGLDLNTPLNSSERGRSRKSTNLGSLITSFAINAGNQPLIEEMVRRGQVAKLSKQERDEAFRSGSGCSASIARMLVAAGADPKAQSENGNALHAVRESLGPCEGASSDRRQELVEALIELGVSLEARDNLGWTPLMGCDDPAMAAALLKAGANPNARDQEGTSVVLSVDDDRVALLLLRAGADPKAKNSDGTLRQQAEKDHWPATLAWLDAHKS